ncbi:MAG: secondary thiamine-phosphate synthase enzyme YjbQ [Bdellovibrionota bacterium]|nr:MAG: secondary thiamine-phosphate synthase enzyme YjbQ [Bdellovibrionota bacterium]
MSNIHLLEIHTPGQGLHEITGRVAQLVGQSSNAEGLCTLFIQHTSASLLIQENADPTARRDLELWLNRLVPEQGAHFSHSLEGPDDMPAHIKSALTTSNLSIPYTGHRLLLGRWQGIFLWEHRAKPHRRSVVVHLG